MTIEAVPAYVDGWIEVSEPGAALVLRIGGELDGDSRRTVELALVAAVASSGSVILDLDELTFCDSNGVAMFISAHEKARTKGTSLVVRNLLAPVRRLFEITNLACLN
jgi:stage II sporulation protein AA (anti-sigma F factor antagonist)